MKRRLLDTFDFILTSDVLYWYLIQNYINPLALLKPVWCVLFPGITSSGFPNGDNIQELDSMQLLPFLNVRNGSKWSVI